MAQVVAVAVVVLHLVPGVGVACLYVSRPPCPAYVQGKRRGASACCSLLLCWLPERACGWGGWGWGVSGGVQAEQNALERGVGQRAWASGQRSEQRRGIHCCCLPACIHHPDCKPQRKRQQKGQNQKKGGKPKPPHLSLHVAFARGETTRKKGRPAHASHSQLTHRRAYPSVDSPRATGLG